MTTSHVRNRQVLELFVKKMRFSPIVSIQGPRQAGKSFFAKNLVPKKMSHATYVSLDSKDDRVFANSNPRSFVEQYTERPLIIDEAQKAPDLFDELKSRVDDVRTPGQFVLLGSTEFSIETKVRESLTGRLGRIRLFPFNLSETLKLDLAISKTQPFLFQASSRATRSELLRYLTNGGFPGIFNVKDSHERDGLISDWITLTVERDIHQIKKLQLDSEEALIVIEKIASLPEPNLTEIAHAANLTTKKTKDYLNALQKLFVIFEVRPFKGSTGKVIYFLTDTALLNYLKAPFEKKLLTWFYLEIYSQISYRTGVNRPLYYYRTTKGRYVHLLYEFDQKKLLAVKILPKESFDERDLIIFKSIEKKYSKDFSIETILLTGSSTKKKIGSLQILPWESLA